MSARSYSRVIHWFRRDLRLTDNTALHHAAAESGEVVTVYIISPWRGEHRWTGPARQEFLCGCLESLEKNLEGIGGRLVFRRGHAVAELERLIHETKAEAVYLNRDPDPHGREVERALETRCRKLGVAVHAFKDAALHERDEALTAAGKPYRVYTPYSKAWHALPKPPVLPRVSELRSSADVKSEPRPTLQTWGLEPSGATLPEAGERAARERMKGALDRVVSRYAETRDVPSAPGTSRLSVDLRHGTLSIRELYHRAVKLGAESKDAETHRSVRVWLNELAWREFYMQILWHWPEVLEHEFDPKFRGLAWSYDEAALVRWRDGMTGFPIVDAAMRELRETGFMHNRARMITAMFLTKDLRLDWRLGEEHFMRSLVDGEIASNNGGWQWCAGTGADASPYFRIQNPWSQTKTHDPDGTYIRRWVPELKHAPTSALLTPPAPGMRISGAAKNYPLPMVEHSEERIRTLAMFQKHKERHIG